MDVNDILKTQYSFEFDEIRKKMVATSYFKYGDNKINFGGNPPLLNALKCADLCIQKYIKTGNTEYLADAANYLSFEFKYPHAKNAHYKPTKSEESAGLDSLSINEIIKYGEEHKYEDS